MLIMQHEFKYSQGNESKMIISAMAIIGENQEETAMAKTVGLPLGIATKLLAKGKIDKTGIHRPITPDIYEPILQELETFGIKFKESEYLVDAS
jgi:saccharopine dehydrogenase-like NADP-dependent oxidoreductase